MAVERSPKLVIALREVQPMKESTLHEDDGETIPRVFRYEALARDWELVLLSQGLAPKLIEYVLWYRRDGAAP